MSKHKKRSIRELPAKRGGRRTVVIAVTTIVAVGIFAAAVLLRGRGPEGACSPSASPTAQAVIPAAAGQDFRALSGRWLRPDGGYVLDIRDVDAGGKMDVTYLNPRSIHVARAEATQDGPALKVFVELRAPGYPGSTYTLTYDSNRDQLAGVYFQAALRQSFDVVFVQMK